MCAELARYVANPAPLLLRRALSGLHGAGRPRALGPGRPRESLREFAFLVMDAVHRWLPDRFDVRTDRVVSLWDWLWDTDAQTPLHQMTLDRAYALVKEMSARKQSPGTLLSARPLPRRKLLRFM